MNLRFNNGQVKALELRKPEPLTVEERRMFEALKYKDSTYLAYEKAMASRLRAIADALEKDGVLSLGLEYSEQLLIKPGQSVGVEIHLKVPGPILEQLKPRIEEKQS